MSEKNDDSLEKFFQKAVRQTDTSFMEEDWQKMEKLLDAYGGPKPAGTGSSWKKIAGVTSGVVILSVLVYFLFFNIKNDSHLITSASENAAIEKTQSKEKALPTEIAPVISSATEQKTDPAFIKESNTDQSEKALNSTRSDNATGSDQKSSATTRSEIHAERSADQQSQNSSVVKAKKEKSTSSTDNSEKRNSSLKNKNADKNATLAADTDGLNRKSKINDNASETKNIKNNNMSSSKEKSSVKPSENNSTNSTTSVDEKETSSDSRLTRPDNTSSQSDNIIAIPLTSASEINSQKSDSGSPENKEHNLKEKSTLAATDLQRSLPVPSPADNNNHGKPIASKELTTASKSNDEQNSTILPDSILTQQRNEQDDDKALSSEKESISKRDDHNKESNEVLSNASSTQARQQSGNISVINNTSDKNITSAKETVVAGDSIAKITLKDNTKTKDSVTSENKKPPEEELQRGDSRWNAALVVAPEFSSTTFRKMTTPGGVVGILIGYKILNRITITSGILRTSKKYVGYGKDYEPPAGYWKYKTNGVVPDEISGQCAVIEIPLILQYDFRSTAKSRIYGSIGLSSYRMLSESYDYKFDNPNEGAATNWSSSKPSSYTFSIGHLSAAYERNISRGLWVGLEPYVKIPFKGIGWSKVDLLSTGVYINVRYRFQKKI